MVPSTWSMQHIPTMGLFIIRSRVRLFAFTMLIYVVHMYGQDKIHRDSLSPCPTSSAKRRRRLDARWSQRQPPCWLPSISVVITIPSLSSHSFAPTARRQPLNGTTPASSQVTYSPDSQRYSWTNGRSGLNSASGSLQVWCVPALWNR